MRRVVGLALLAGCSSGSPGPGQGAVDTAGGACPAQIVTCANCRVSVDFGARMPTAVETVDALDLSLSAVDAVDAACTDALSQSTITAYDQPSPAGTAVDVDVGPVGTSALVVFHGGEADVAVVLAPTDAGPDAVVVP